MSAINGDKARFHRNRKAKIARRALKRQRFANLKGQSGSSSAAMRAVKPSA
jgi:hypothetical protein